MYYLDLISRPSRGSYNPEAAVCHYVIVFDLYYVYMKKYNIILQVLEFELNQILSDSTYCFAIYFFTQLYIFEIFPF